MTTMSIKVIILCALVSLASARNINNFVNSFECKPTTTGLTVDTMIAADGYPFEKHVIQTSDGYLLTLFRIPYGTQRTSRSDRQPVLLQHGLLSSSADWIILGPGKALAYILADAGYDVWLGNARGNTYSRFHAYLNVKSKKFWNFSWHEIGQIDLPAMIDYILTQTGYSSLHYAGHSQGTTAFFVMGALRPDYNDKIRTMHALAPVAFMSNLVSPFIRATALFVNTLKKVMNLLGIYEFLPNNEILQLGGSLACKDGAVFQEVCANVIFLIGGYNSGQLNRSILPTVIANVPAGASVNQLVHYGQEINSGKFRMFDYGLMSNLLQYGKFTPPDYDVSKIKAPVYLHYSANDWMAAVVDVEKLADKLGNLASMNLISDPKFNHLDFVWGSDANTLLYSTILDIMQNN